MRAHRSVDASRRDAFARRNEFAAVAIVAYVAAFVTACALPHRAQQDAARPDIVGLDGDAIVVPDGDAIVPDGDIIDVPIDVDSGCPGGMQFCNGMCVAVDTVQRCGSCSNDCTALAGVDPSGTQCSMGACVITTCQADRGDCDHLASTGCETAITDSTNCGACGTMCTGTTPVCSRDMTTGVYACAGGCPPGQTRCPSGSCTDTASDPANCGACAMACPTPTGAMATCTSGVCGITCIAGYHLCGSTCIANTSVSGCGTSCGACATDPNGTATCDGTSCGLACNTGYHACGTTCLSSMSTASCGTSCSACPTPPAGSVATCDGTTCGTTCAPGYHLCSGVCSSDLSPLTCGTRCTACTAPAGMVASCDGTTCGTMCAPGYVMMGTGCVLMSCNNQMLDSGEQCDDGNNATGDGCDANCQLEPGTVVTGCPTTAGVTITQRGTYVFSGSTTGIANTTGSCGPGGEQGIAASISVSLPFTVTVRLERVTTGYDVILRHGPSCAGGSCTDAVGPNMPETYNIMFTTFGPAGPFFWIVDGKGPTPSGAWRLVVTVS